MLISLSVVLVGIWQYQNISDWLALRNYTPPQRIVDLADKTTMNDDMRRLFYINHPELDGKAAFNAHCREGGEQTIVLGCFIDSGGIFLLDVQDKRLNGVIEVTSAHEALHAAYDRLSSDERAQVDSMTEQAFANLGDQRVKDVIEQYRKKDASVVSNELHSILGTEVEKLPPELEAYYSQYFEDRSKIVDYLKQYEGAFAEIKNQVGAYDRQLGSLKSSIEANESSLEARNQEIIQERARLDELLSAKKVDEYNNAVPGFNQLVQNYNSLIATTKDLIDRYNSLVEKRNQAATTEQELVQALDSSQLPPAQ